MHSIYGNATHVASVCSCVNTCPAVAKVQELKLIEDLAVGALNLLASADLTDAITGVRAIDIYSPPRLIIVRAKNSSHQPQAQALVVISQRIVASDT